MRMSGLTGAWAPSARTLRLSGTLLAELETHLDDLTAQQLDENERLDRRLGALGQDVKAQRHAAAELRTHLDDLTALVRELAERQAAETRGERAIWWPDLPAGKERTAALRLLGAWIDEVLRGHHPELVNDSLQACWYRHDDVLDELTALRAAWYAAYRGKAAPATAAIEWHDRWLPGCMARCKAAIKARPCDQDGHRSRPGTGASGDSAAVQEFTASGSGGPQAPERHRPRGRPARAGGQARQAKPPATDHGRAASPETAPG